MLMNWNNGNYFHQTAGGLFQRYDGIALQGQLVYNLLVATDGTENYTEILIWGAQLVCNLTNLDNTERH